MTITKCDICRNEIKEQGPHKYEFSAVLEVGKPFRFSIQVDTFQFNCTNVDICRSCIIRAAVKALPVL